MRRSRSRVRRAAWHGRASTGGARRLAASWTLTIALSSTMRIGIDARELCGHATGVGRYLGGLLSAWSGGDAARRHEFVLYAPDEIPLTLDTRRFATRQIPAA